MELQALAPDRYLDDDDVIDQTSDVRERAAGFRSRHPDDVEFSRAVFEYVRDQIDHSVDVQDPRVTLAASEVLEHGVGLCYAKSHLLVALLRAQGIPAGLCYQRLTDDGRTYLLHGLIAVHLRGEWHRQDARGNKDGVDAQFRLDTEQLAWRVRPELGELDYPRVHRRPSVVVTRALRECDNILELCAGGLPTEL